MLIEITEESVKFIETKSIQSNVKLRIWVYIPAQINRFTLPTFHFGYYSQFNTLILKFTLKNPKSGALNDCFL